MATLSASAGDLLQLQGKIKRDPESYHEEFSLQHLHYKAALEIFLLKPHGESKEFADLVMFLSQISSCYPTELEEFPNEIINLLNVHSAILNPPLRKHLTQALILLRNRQVINPDAILPLFFKMFRCNDKMLRTLLFSHIVHDIQRVNLKHKNDRLNRWVQNFLYDMVQDEVEIAAKKSLAVIIELYRRKVWTDSKTVNVIASACFNNSTRIMLSALKFFLGNDEQNDDDDDDDVDEDGEGKDNRSLSMDKELIYKAHHKGTVSSKKKKQAKLKRVIQSLKKKQKEDMYGEAKGEAIFAALHLLNDPQGFSEKLFSRLRTCNEKFEVKMMMMNVISRLIGTHKLIILNFYPFLQKYLQPHQRDITHLLAIGIQACHDEIPPDVVEPMMRQIVNHFVHDRARPEVIAIGINTTREICSRMPLLMTEELLRDLAMYQKSKEKSITSSARSIIALFRELAPSLLEKKDRGKGADLSKSIKAFGEKKVNENVIGIEFLNEQSEDEEDEEEEGEEEEEDEEEEMESADDGEEEDVNDDDEEGDEELEGLDDEENLDEVVDDDDDGDDDMDSEHEDDEGIEKVNILKRKREGERNSEIGKGGEGEAEEVEGEEGEDGRKRKKLMTNKPMEVKSLKELKKIAVIKFQEKKNQSNENDGDSTENIDGILSTEDFKHIRRLKAKKDAELALMKHGLKKKDGKTIPYSVLSKNFDQLNERKMHPLDLTVAMKKKSERDEKIAMAKAGREGQSYCAKSALKQKKSGGLSNREHQKRKQVPLGVHREKVKQRRMETKKSNRRSKQFKGRKAWK